MKRKNLLLSVVSVPFLTTGLVTFVGCEDKPKPEYHNFSTDTWAKVVELSNKGLDSLKEYYDVESFVGLERKVTINGIEHTVKVIGENEDFECINEHGLYEPDYTKPVALTFQFDTVISRIDEDGEILPVKVQFVDETGVPGWGRSNAKKYLNDPEYQPPEVIRNEYQPFITQLTQQLGSDAIKEVCKSSFKTNRMFYWSDTFVEKTPEKVFLPALADIYTGRDCMPDTPDSWGDSYKDFYVNEGNKRTKAGEQQAYSYYLNKFGTEIKYYDFAKTLVLADARGISRDYWLRTGWLEDPNPKKLEVHHWSVSRWGNCCDGGDVPTPIDVSIAVAPIFCI